MKKKTILILILLIGSLMLGSTSYAAATKTDEKDIATEAAGGGAFENQELKDMQKTVKNSFSSVIPEYISSKQAEFNKDTEMSNKLYNNLTKYGLSENTAKELTTNAQQQYVSNLTAIEQKKAKNFEKSISEDYAMTVIDYANENNTSVNSVLKDELSYFGDTGEYKANYGYNTNKVQEVAVEYLTSKGVEKIKQQHPEDWEERITPGLNEKINDAIKESVNEGKDDDYFSTLKNKMVNTAFEKMNSTAAGLTNAAIGLITNNLNSYIGESNGNSLKEALTNYLSLERSKAFDKTFDDIEDKIIKAKAGTMTDDELRDFASALNIDMSEFKEMLKETDRDEIAKKAEEQVEAMREALNKEYAKLKKEAVTKVADVVGDIAQNYSNQLFNSLKDDVSEFGQKVGGRFGDAVLTGLMRQIKNIVGKNVKGIVKQFLVNMFTGEKNILQGIKFDFGKINWQALAYDTIFNLVQSFIGKEVAMGLVMAYNMIYRGTISFNQMPFEQYNQTYYMFATLGSWQIPAMVGPSSGSRIKGLSPVNPLPQFDATLICRGGMFEVTTGGKVHAVAASFNKFSAIPIPYLTGVDILSWSPLHALAMSSTVSNFIPTGTRVIGLEEPHLSDSAYVLCEMGANDTADSYVQRALSRTGIYSGTKYSSDAESDALAAEAKKFKQFRETCYSYGSHNGFGKAIRDITEKAYTRYDRDSENYIIGPFKVDYIRDFADVRYKEEFGTMAEIKIYDQNGKKITNNWSLIYSDDARVPRMNGDEDYYVQTGEYWAEAPYPNEDFYIIFYNADENNVQSISKIEIEYKEMQVETKYEQLLSEFEWYYYVENIIPHIVVHGPTAYQHICHAFRTMFWIAPSAINVESAIKYYVNHTQTIELHKQNIPAGYETQYFTTTSSTKISGKEVISEVYGQPINSELYETLENIMDEYGAQGMFDRSSGFFDQVTGALNIYDSTNNNPFMNAWSCIARGIGNQNLIRAVDVWNTTQSALTGKTSYFDIALTIGSFFDKSGKFTQIAQTLKGIYDIVDSVNSANHARGIMKEMKNISQFGDDEYRDTVNSFNEALNEYNLTDKEKLQVINRTNDYMDGKNTDLSDLSVEQRNAVYYMETIAYNTGFQGKEILNVYSELADYSNGKNLNVLSDESAVKKMLTEGSGMTDASKQLWSQVEHVVKNVVTDNVDNKWLSKGLELAVNSGLSYAEGVLTKVDEENDSGKDIWQKAEEAVKNAWDKGIDQAKDYTIEQINGYVGEGISLIDSTVNGALSGITSGITDITSIMDNSEVTRVLNALGEDGVIADVNSTVNSANKLLKSAEEAKVMQGAVYEIQNGLTEVQSKLDNVKTEANKLQKTIESYRDTIGVKQKQIEYAIKEQTDKVKQKTNELTQAITDTNKKVNTEVANAAIEMKTGVGVASLNQNLKSSPKVIMSRFLAVTANLKEKEYAQFIEDSEKAQTIEELTDLYGAYLQRIALRSSEEQKEADEEPFIETTEMYRDSSVLYDSSPYTQYNPKFTITNVERPSEVYWCNDDEIGLTIGVAGVVWKDGHTGQEMDYDGIRGANANGQLEMGIEGVKITLIDQKTGQIGKMYNESGRKVDATTYTDEGGYYHIERVPVGEYDVEFEYDGQTYKTTYFLAEGNGAEYVEDPDNEVYYNNSKAIEDANERQAFNDKFNEITNGYAIAKDGTKTPLAYQKIDGESKLITLDEAGHVLPQFAMHARTTTTGLTYPIDSMYTLDDVDTQMVINGTKYTFYSSGEYMYHVNLGLVERSKIDLALVQDVYTVDTTVNQKQETYEYNKRGPIIAFDRKLKETDAYNNYKYTRELYKADWQFRVSDYKFNELNKLDRNGNNKSDEISDIQAIKTEEEEEKVFVTYKMTIRNQSILQSATVNELVDYFDSTFDLVTEDTYMNIQDEEGNAGRKLVAKQSYYQRENGEIGKLNWTQTGKHNTDLYPGFNTIYTTGLENFILNTGEKIYVYITFEVDKDAKDAIILGEKHNLVEISNYSSFEIGAENKEIPEGLIDKDSEPGTANPYGVDECEDDSDHAPVLTLKLYEDTNGANGRMVTGYVWDDNRTKTLKSGQKIGNGVRQTNEDLINGVRVQLVEKIKDPATGQMLEYVWKEMYTGEDDYSYVENTGAISNLGGEVNYGSVTENTSMGSVGKGEYKFNNYIAGNFIVRFIYGDTEKTYLTNEKGGRNEVSYNGQDYKSTTYQLGANINEKWYDLGDVNQNNRLMSDAKDDQTRRIAVMDYSRTVKNDNAEVLASFDARLDRNSYGDERNYYDETKHKELRDRTWMFADTALFNVQGEYNTAVSSGTEDLSYYIKNIDLGLEERPETKIELNKEITGIKLTLASGEVIVDTASGISKNVAWISKKKTEVKGVTYKRETKKYDYVQGTVNINMDEEVMQGANLQVDYRITIINNSEVDYAKADGTPGVAYYQGRVDYSRDKIVTTTVDKIVDYVDNSMVFRKLNSDKWTLIENMQDFMTDETAEEAAQAEAKQKELEQNAYGEWIERQMRQYGEDYVAEHLAEFEQRYKTQNAQQISVMQEKTGLSNYETLKAMQERLGYLNPSLNIVQTKTGKFETKPISQVIVTKDLEKTQLKPGQTATVDLTLVKTLSPQDEAETLSYRNVAEILQLSNTVGRRDMDAIPGNQDPDVKDTRIGAQVMPDEYDADTTERILIIPPTGDNKAFYFVLATVVLVILSGGIFLIKKKVLDKK